MSPDTPQIEVYANGEPLIEWRDEEAADEAYKDLWERIRAGFAMHELDSPLVQRHEAWYLNRPEYVERMIDRSRYLYHIVEEVEKRGMPTEIALLPMIESAFNPVAYSRMRAAGMWQFIPSTAGATACSRLGGTTAAATCWPPPTLRWTTSPARHVRRLAARAGSLQLGRGRGEARDGQEPPRGQAHRLREPEDAQETRNYLPKLQAVKNIVANPELFARPGHRSQPAVLRRGQRAGAHGRRAGRQARRRAAEEFRYLNPGHQRPVITVANRQLLVPIDKVDVFQSNLESNDQPLVTWQTYQLKKGEKLEHVASKFDISLERLNEVNGLTSRKRVRPGQMVLVPMEDDATTNLDETYASTDFQAPVDDYHKRVIYRVKSGDTLSSIARRYGTSVSRIKDWNGMRSNTVRAGSA